MLNSTARVAIADGAFLAHDINVFDRTFHVWVIA